MITQPPIIDQMITFVSVQDLARTAVFYQEILRLPLVLDQGSCHIYRVTGQAFVGVCEHLDGAELGPDGVILTLVTEDVDGWHTYLRAHEVTIEKPPTLNERFNIYQLFARDPDGYLIEIQKFEDEQWPIVTRL